MSQYQLKSAEAAINEAKSKKMPQVGYTFSTSRTAGPAIPSTQNKFGNGGYAL